MIDLSVLNPPQRKAVETVNGPLLVLAGAGSGKTRVLTYRIAYLMERGVPAWKILALTFTNKAAREMAERVHNLTGEAGEEAWVSTFHSTCARILRRDIDKLGYKPTFSIYDTDDSMNVLKDICKTVGFGKDVTPKSVYSVIMNAKGKQLTPSEWLQHADPDRNNQKYFEAYKMYEKTLKGNNALDFEDLLLKTLILLTEHPPVLEYYQNRFDYVLVDEYQDTNRTQYDLIHLLTAHKRNLCVVGDDDQSIYGWRGADIRNILDFEKDYPEVKTIRLEQNYRSTGNILDAANQVIAHNTGRKEKTLWTEAPEGEKITVQQALDERDEASFVAANIAQTLSQGTRAGEIAVLYRVNAQSRVLEEAMVKARLPYRVYGGLKFYDRKEVKDLLAYMRLMVNPDDDVSLRRIINEPKRGIGDTTVELLAKYAENSNDSLMNALLSWEEINLTKRASKPVSEFATLMVELTGLSYEMNPSDFLQELIDKTGYVVVLEASKNEEDKARIENIKELQGAVAEYMKNNPDGTLGSYLENVALVTDTDSIDERGGAVTLMTLHSAKGLEFDTVFITGMEESIFPSSRAIGEGDEKSLEEERRLAYVGITRAKKKLFLTHARSRALYNNRNMNAPSRFLDEIPRRLINGTSRAMPARNMPTANQSRAYAPRQTGTQTPPKYNAPSYTPPARQKHYVGENLKHPSFGIGVVVEIGDGKFTVEFAGGVQKRFKDSNA